MNHVALANVFNQCFAADDVVMRGGFDEPLYLPAKDASPAELRYREDHAASVLHEAAHWCIAGPQRRTQIDFGYAYVPPPRSEAQQQAFYLAELKVQALEWQFADAAALPFVASADNLQADPRRFVQALAQARLALPAWLATDAGRRAQRFCSALASMA